MSLVQMRALSVKIATSSQLFASMQTASMHKDLALGLVPSPFCILLQAIKTRDVESLEIAPP